MPWSRSSFLIGENLFNLCIFRNPFLIGVFLIRGKRGAQNISLYPHAWRPSKATSGLSASPTTSSGLSASPTPSSRSSASPTPSSGSSEIHISPSAYSLQLTVFSLLSPAYCLQLTVSSLLSPAYYLHLTVPKMQPSSMGWSYRLYNKVVSHEWSWQPCYVRRLW